MEVTNPTVEEGGRVVWEKGHFVSGDPGVTNAREENNTVVFDVGSGNYAFRIVGE
jgi:hypothetical protein